MSGAIGDVLSVDFHWMLDTSHGADYFRRWHGEKENSGGLMVHKSTHHFDLVNWWLSSIPEAVYASGHRKFYTPHQADRYGLTNRADRCTAQSRPSARSSSISPATSASRKCTSTTKSTTATIATSACSASG